MSAIENAEPSSTPSKTYLLGVNSLGRQIVSVHVKRTYRLKENGVCTRAEGEIGLMFGPNSPEDTETFPETDVLPFKTRTDLIVMAKAWARGASQVTAGIRVADRSVGFQVFGKRRVIYGGRGALRFSSPESFESMEMRYENAYGGFDEHVPAPEVRHVSDLLEIDPGEYPRNTVGKGYAVGENRARLDGLELPNLEDPSQLLTPETLVVRGAENWWRQPLPWSCDWFAKLWYPRLVHYRGIPRGIPDDDRDVAEVRRGWLEPGHARRAAEMTLADGFDSRCADAAAPALLLPFSSRIEPIELLAMTPSGRMLVQLPDDRPHIRIRILGRDWEPIAVPHRVLISALEMGVYVVWHAAVEPAEPLPKQRPGSDASMVSLLEGVQAFVDGEALVPLGGEEPRQLSYR